MDYSARNEHIRKAQFHVAISCRGHEYSQEQLLDIAHQYLHEMDYDDEGSRFLSMRTMTPATITCTSSPAG
jgi:hypothetical protein